MKTNLNGNIYDDPKSGVDMSAIIKEFKESGPKAFFVEKDTPGRFENDNNIIMERTGVVSVPEAPVSTSMIPIDSTVGTKNNMVTQHMQYWYDSINGKKDDVVEGTGIDLVVTDIEGNSKTYTNLIPVSISVGAGNNSELTQNITYNVDDLKEKLSFEEPDAITLIESLETEIKCAEKDGYVECELERLLKEDRSVEIVPADMSAFAGTEDIPRGPFMNTKQLEHQQKPFITTKNIYGKGADEPLQYFIIEEPTMDDLINRSEPIKYDTNTGKYFSDMQAVKKYYDEHELSKEEDTSDTHVVIVSPGTAKHIMGGVYIEGSLEEVKYVTNTLNEVEMEPANSSNAVMNYEVSTVDMYKLTPWVVETLPFTFETELVKKLNSEEDLNNPLFTHIQTRRYMDEIKGIYVIPTPEIERQIFTGLEETVKRLRAETKEK